MGSRNFPSRISPSRLKQAFRISWGGNTSPARTATGGGGVAAGQPGLPAVHRLPGPLPQLLQRQPLRALPRHHPLHADLQLHLLRDVLLRRAQRPRPRKPAPPPHTTPHMEYPQKGSLVRKKKITSHEFPNAADGRKIKKRGRGAQNDDKKRIHVRCSRCSDIGMQH